MTREYKESLDFLFSQLPMFSRVGAAAYKPGLETSIALDNYFGNPHRKFRTIHVGGTNGKGSTSHLLASILQSQGYKVGLYTSPHLVDFRERMKVNGEMIPEDCVVEFVDQWKKSSYPGHPSFFELTMAMAFNWFAKENVDLAIIEVGMGGRLDSTNIITPEVCVITNISPDHTQFLGQTLPQIASEKAGIIKPGVPVVVGEAEGDVRRVFEEKAAAEKAPIVFSEDSPRLLSVSEQPDGWKCSSREGEFTVPLPGDYQKKNIETVLHAVDAIRGRGIEISEGSVCSGMENVVDLTGLMGRWMRLSDTPLVIADTGHNIAGINYNMSQLERLRKARLGSRLHIILGFVADKDIDKILTLLPEDADYYLTNAAIPRALPSEELKNRFVQSGLTPEKYADMTLRVFPDVLSAYREAVEGAAPDDIIFVGGSTFIVADLLAEIL